MKSFLLISFWFVSYTLLASRLPDGPLQEEAFRLLSESGRPEKIAKMTPEAKRAMIEYLRRVDHEGQEPSFGYQWAMLFLGDEETIQQLVRDKRWDMLADNRDPRMAELIAPGMFANDQPVSEQVFPRSVLAEQALIGMLLEMPEVPERIKTWIRHFGDTDVDWVEHRQIFRDWWTKNEAAWRRRDFAALEPGPDMSHRRRPDLILHERKAAAVSPRPALPTPAPVAPMPSTLTTPAPKAIATDSSRPGLAVIGGLVALGVLAVGLLVWQQARRSRD